jgi:hypothetical protein
MVRLSCGWAAQRGEVNLIGRAAVKARVRSAAVVEVEIASNRFAGLGHGVVDPVIHLLVFDAAPQPLDEDCLATRPAVHADRDAVLDPRLYPHSPIRLISVVTCRRPKLLPSAASRSRNSRLPAEGNVELNPSHERDSVHRTHKAWCALCLKRRGIGIEN